jgi:E3 ubiquitin-protein ligase TRIP12
MKTFPVSSKICSTTWDREAMQGHKQRLMNAKPMTNTGPPPVYPHLVNRAKKEQMLEERYTQIEYENRVLLKKMSKILRTTSMDNLNAQAGLNKSLNSLVRKKELRRIMEDNHKILVAIQSKKPYYNRRDWDRHAKDHSGYRSTMQSEANTGKLLLKTRYDHDPRLAVKSAPMKQITDQTGASPRQLAPPDPRQDQNRGAGTQQPDTEQENRRRGGVQGQR